MNKQQEFKDFVTSYNNMMVDREKGTPIDFKKLNQIYENYQKPYTCPKIV